MQKGGESKKIRPAQEQEMPGIQQEMKPKPIVEKPKSENKLQGKVALITGGDSGIGAAVAILFAQHGADISIVYLSEHEDAEEVKSKVEKYGRKCLLLPGNVRDENFCKKAIENTIKEFGKLDILVTMQLLKPNKNLWKTSVRIN